MSRIRKTIIFCLFLRRQSRLIRNSRFWADFFTALPRASSQGERASSVTSRRLTCLSTKTGKLQPRFVQLPRGVELFSSWRFRIAHDLPSAEDSSLRQLSRPQWTSFVSATFGIALMITTRERGRGLTPPGCGAELVSQLQLFPVAKHTQRRRMTLLWTRCSSVL